MELKVTVTKLLAQLSGLLKDDTHTQASTFEVLVPSTHVIAATPGEMRFKRVPHQLEYTLLRNESGIERIVFSSEGPLPNPWRGKNILISIPGKTAGGEPIDGWNCDTWTVLEPLEIDGFVIETVCLTKLTEVSAGRFLAEGQIHIFDATATLFGDDYVVEHTGYFLVNPGISTNAPQEVDLAKGKNLESDGLIVQKIEVIG